MKIWYLSAYDQPRGKSARTYEYSIELVRLGHQVTMFTNSYCHWSHEEKLGLSEKFKFEEIDGVGVAWLKTRPYVGNGLGRALNMCSNMFRIWQASSVLKESPDVVIAPSVPIGTGLVGALLAKKYDARFVYEVRDVWPIALVYDGSLSKLNPAYWVFRLIEKWLYKSADKISATMPKLAPHVAQSGGDISKITWLPNGVDLARFKGMDSYSGGVQDEVVVMYVGGFGAAHDVMSLILAAKEIKDKKIDGFKFIIIGDGPKKAACVDAAQSWHLENVEFRKPVDKAEVPKVQLEADLLVACVLNSEAYKFGLNLNKLFDYFASGRPVLFSGNAPNDPVEESGGGYSVPPQSPTEMVEALLKYKSMPPTDRVRMGHNGQCFVQNNFQMKKLGQKMESMLAEEVGNALQSTV